MPLRRPPQPRTAEELVATQLRAAIVGGDLLPGERIRQDATAQELGVSLIPVREALKSLAGEGLLTYRAQKGFRVTELDAADLGRIFEVRSLLESRAEALAAAAAGPEVLAALRTATARHAAAMAVFDPLGAMASNREFHFVLFDACGNPVLARYIGQLWDTTDPYRVIAYRRILGEQRPESRETVSAHEAIVTALAAGDVTETCALLEHHRGQSEEILRAFVGERARDAADASD